MFFNRKQTVLERLRNSETDAFAELYNEFAPASLAFVNSYINDMDAAKDLVHDVFVNIWLKRDQVSRALSFRAYLFRMLKNEIADYFYSKSTLKKYNERLIYSYDDCSDNVSDNLDELDLRTILSEAIDNMPERRRTIFLMSRCGNIPNEKIAVILGISQRTVENTISLALSDIRKNIEKNNGSPVR